MKPFRDYDMGKVIANQWAALHEKIDSMSNEEIMANDLDVLVENMYQEFFIEPVTIFEEDFSRRSIKQGKIQKYVDPFFRDVYGREYVEVDGVIAKFYFPYQGDKTLFQCQGSTFSLGGYPEISLNGGALCFSVEKSLSEMKADGAKENLLKQLEHQVQEIKDGIGYVNNDVSSFNEALRQKAKEELEAKRKKVESYFSIAQMFEVPVEKKEYAQTHIPLKRNIVPTAKRYESSPYYGISDSDYRDILETIKHTVSTYERTPSSYASLQEEDLRNTLLAALNATYKGDATGETFRKTGKTDICIERESREAFVAECKMWTGQKAVAGAISQLDGYLTWRDCKTALIYFVRKKDFLKILGTAEEALKAIPNMRSVKALDKNEFDCLYLSESNPGQQVKMRVLLFNLYSPSNAKTEEI